MINDKPEEPTLAPVKHPFEFDIKRSYTFCGIRIRVHVVSDAEMTRRGYGHGGWFYDMEKGVARIFLNETNPLELQRYTLLHEGLHAVHDILDQALEHGQFVKLGREVLPKKDVDTGEGT